MQRAVFSVTLALTVFTKADSAQAQGPRPVVIMVTSLGEVHIELFPEKAPVTVKNFLHYVEDKFYDGLILHRVIRDFVIQGGGFQLGMTEKQARTPPVKHEPNVGVSNKRGTVALARTTDPNSGTSQFFINVQDNPTLDGDPATPGYTVFGRVVAGMDVVDKIRAVPTTMRAGHDHVPVKEVVIQTLRLAHRLTLLATAEVSKGRVFDVTAFVEHPARAQTLALRLPSGMDLVEGKELQPVGAPLARATSVVLWKLRAREEGQFTLTVMSNTGAVHTHHIRVTGVAKR